MKSDKFGLGLTAREHLASGQPITRLEALVLYWLARHLIHLGLRIMPPGRARREITDLLTTWGRDAMFEIAASR